MIDVQEHNQCCGCAACASACPVGCIHMNYDAEGFNYPKVDMTMCLGCGKCERVCPFIAHKSVNHSRRAPVAYGAISLDHDVRMASSSGGVFTEICRPILGQGGIVFGVAMNQDCKGCSFICAENEDELMDMRGSKYIQADSAGVWNQVMSALNLGREVLFSGTPCQANALRCFLGRDWPNLTIVDFVCHGVPSQRLWSEHVAYVERKAGARVRSVNFRCKKISWRRFGLEANTKDKIIFEPLDCSAYLRMFLRNYCLRPSCYACQAKSIRFADITIADFWGGERFVPDMCDEMGCSLVIVRSERGAKAFKRIASFVEMQEVPYLEATKTNSCERLSVVRPPERDRFYNDLSEHGYDWLIHRYTRTLPKERLTKIKRTVREWLVPLAQDHISRLRGWGHVSE